MTKLKKKSNIDKTKQNQTVTKLKKNTRLWQNSRTQTVIKLTKKKCDKTWKIKLWPNSKTQIVGGEKMWQPKNSNCDIYKNYSNDRSSYNDTF